MERNNFLTLIETITLFAAVVLLLYMFSSQTTLVGFLESWQTLITGIIAFIGAWWTIKTMQEQMKQDRKKTEDSMNRRSRSVRASMNEAISESLQYTRKCYFQISSQEYSLETRPEINYPARPKEAIKIFIEGIEFSDNITSKQLSALAKGFQTSNSRFISISNSNTISSNWRDNCICNFVLLNIFLLNLFPYARHQVEVVTEPSITEESIGEALRNLMGDNFFDHTGEYNRLLKETSRMIIQDGHTI